MVKKRVAICVVFISAIFAVGCSSSGGSSSSASSGGVGANTAANGTWFRPCTIDDANVNLSDGVYEVTTLVFNGNNLTATILSYSDEDCAVPAVPHEFVLTQTIAYPGGSVETPLGDAQFIDITATGATLDGVPPPINVFPLTEYEIILVSDSTMYFGFGENDDVGETPATRPTMLDTEFTFTRQ